MPLLSMRRPKPVQKLAVRCEPACHLLLILPGVFLCHLIFEQSGGPRIFQMPHIIRLFLNTIRPSTAFMGLAGKQFLPCCFHVLCLLSRCHLPVQLSHIHLHCIACIPNCLFFSFMIRSSRPGSWGGTIFLPMMIDLTTDSILSCLRISLVLYIIRRLSLLDDFVSPRTGLPLIPHARWRVSHSCLVARFL